MRSPAFEKNVTPRDAWASFKTENRFAWSRRTPGRRPEFAEGIVLGSDTLEIK